MKYILKKHPNTVIAPKSVYLDAALKKAFGIKSTEAASCKCPSCGASLSGIKDEVVICPYCGTSNKL